MAEQQWEFCLLALNGSKEQKGKGYSYDVWVTYYGSKTETYQIAEIEGKNMKIWSYNPFNRALGLLGNAGWELVSHQFASGKSEGFPAYIYFNYRTAMFKRSCQSGRAVDEPKLVDLIKS